MSNLNFVFPKKERNIPAIVPATERRINKGTRKNLLVLLPFNSFTKPIIAANKNNPKSPAITILISMLAKINNKITTRIAKTGLNHRRILWENRKKANKGLVNIRREEKIADNPPAENLFFR
jgi:hypothetical protein